jgi:[acyl-carrier-protein] S-malonyltransferase
MNYTFLFPGQGSQKVGMGQDFFKAFDIAKQRFNEANDTLGRDLASICFDGPEDVLTATQNTQPALFTVESIICDTLREKSIIPSITAGHSLGEYGALYAAGFISFTDGIRITAKRGELMARAGMDAPGAMAAVMGMPLRQIQDVLSAQVKDIVVCANQNSPDQTVISGEVGAVKDACEKLKIAGAKRAIPLPVSGAFHSPLMQGAADEFAAFIASFTFQSPRCPVIDNVTARAENDPAKVKELLVEQLISPVKWVDSMKLLASLEFGICIESGPGSVLRNLAKKCQDQLNVLPCGTVEDVYSFIPNPQGG